LIGRQFLKNCGLQYFLGIGTGFNSADNMQLEVSQAGSTLKHHADVPSQAHSAWFPISTTTHREVLAPIDRAEEKAGPKDVGEQALMRGLDTAFPFFRLGLSLV
jgi:hypothetical protein